MTTTIDNIQSLSLRELGVLEKAGRVDHGQFKSFFAVRMEEVRRGYKCHCCSAYHHRDPESFRHSDCSLCLKLKVVPREDCVYLEA